MERARLVKRARNAQGGSKGENKGEMLSDEANVGKGKSQGESKGEMLSNEAKVGRGENKGEMLSGEAKVGKGSSGSRDEIILRGKGQWARDRNARFYKEIDKHTKIP